MGIIRFGNFFHIRWHALVYSLFPEQSSHADSSTKNRHSIGQRKPFWSVDRSIDRRARRIPLRHGLGECRLYASPYFSNLFPPIFIRRNSIVHLLTEDLFQCESLNRSSRVTCCPKKFKISTSVPNPFK